jgi:PmbA protein
VSEELFALADRVLAGARPGEQVEVVVARSRDTQVRVYEGQVESLSSAESQGVGVRVIADHRQGFAYAGTLDPAAVDDALADARDNAGFATPDEHVGLAEPDGVPVPQLSLFDQALEPPPPIARWSSPPSSSGPCSPPIPASSASSRPTTSTP